MKRLVFGLVVAMVAPYLSAQRSLCDYQGPVPSFLSSGHSEEGYFVRVSESGEAQQTLHLHPAFHAWVAKGLLPPRSNYWPEAEYLSAEAGAATFCAGPGSGGRGSWPAQVLAALPLDGIWRGVDPLSCLRSFAQAAGLEVVVPQPGLWVIGPPELVRQAALVVFAYPIEVTPRPPENEASVRELELAFLARLPIRMFAPPIQRDDRTWNLSPALVGLGYDAVPGEPDTYLVVATQGTFTNPIYGPEELQVTAAKVRVQRGGGRLTAECLWARGVAGPLVPGIQEDINGDGIQDFYFQQADLDGESSDVVVSGADGATITTAIGETLAVEKNATGPRRFSVGRPGVESPKAQVYRFDMQSKHLEVVGHQIAGSATTVLPGTRARPLEWPADVLAAELGSMDKVKVYCLPGFRAPHTPGMDFTQLHRSPVWGWFLNKNPREAIEQLPPNLAMHIVFKYLSPGYIEARAKEGHQQP